MSKAYLKSFWTKLRTFQRATEANVVIIFALSLIPMVGLVGAAIDYGRANAARTDMQSALDATALMLSKEVLGLTDTQLQGKATNYFNALFTRPQVTDLLITPVYSTSGGSQLVVTGTATVANDFMGILGQKTTKIGAMSQVKWGNSRLRVALVLDNTGSMASAGKMTALKKATKNLLTQLKEAATNSADVYVSIIPFSKDVNVGAANYNATWLDWSEWDSENGKYSGKKKKKTWTPDDHKTWNGCVTDRGNTNAPHTQNWDQKIDAPVAGVTASLYPAEEYNYCPLQLMPLNNDWTAMNSLVDKMYPAGSTNQPIGLVWGWLSLAGVTPLTAPPKDANYTYQQVIILLSDGLNTQDRWYGVGYAVSPPVDQRMYNPSDGSGTCANIKAAGITLYTVQVNTDGDPTSTLLQKCASDMSKFFLLTSANQMISTFEKIGSNLSQLRLAK